MDVWSTPRLGRSNPRGRDPVTIVQEAGSVLGPVWGTENALHLMGFDHQVRQSNLPGLKFFLFCRLVPRLVGGLEELTRKYDCAAC
jgi:hypothetical protein